MTDQVRFIYEDGDILVAHKSAGMATEGARVGRIDLISAVRNYLSRRNRNETKGRQRNLPPYVATVNRLDQPVEGVLVLAKNKAAASKLSRQIKEKSAGKYYYALCYGIPEKERDLFRDNIARREDNSMAIVISDDERATFKEDSITLESGEKVRLIGGGVKDASLEYEIVNRTDKTALLRIHLLTGRYHQIRAQLSKRGYPILGDRKYSTEESRIFSEGERIENIALVAYRIDIKHPGSGKKMTFEVIPDNEAIKRMLKLQEK